MSRAAAGRVLAVVLFVAAPGVACGGSSDAASSRLAEALRSTEPAEPPFAALTAAEVKVGDRALELVIADSDAELTQGLRGRSSLGRYDGMVFVFPADVETAFTMSTVPVALDIAFFDASGHRVDRLRMQPCAGTEAECPRYRADAPFRYALETLAGDLPPGPLRAP